VVILQKELAGVLT